MIDSDVSDPYCLDVLAAKLEAGGSLETREQLWLLGEAYRLTRGNLALDSQFAVIHRANRERSREISALQSELADWTDKCQRLQERLEALQYAADYSARLASRSALTAGGAAL